MAQQKQLQLFLVGTGFAMFLTMNSFSLWGFSFFPQAAFGNSGSLFWSTPLTLSNIITFFIYGFGSIKFPRLFNRAPYFEAIALMSIGMICLVGFLSTESLILLSSAGTFVGVGTTCCFICWEKIFYASTQKNAQKQILLGSTLSLVPFSLFFIFEPSALLFVVGLVVFFNLALLYVCLRLFGENTPEEKDPLVNKEPYRNLKKQFWKPFLCIIMIGLISPVLGTTASPNSLPFLEQGILIHSANFCSAFLLFIIWFVLKKEITLSRAYMVIFPVLITAFLVFPFLQENYRISVLFVGSLGFVLFSIVMMMTCLSIAREKQISLVFVYSLFAGITYVSRLLGDGIASLIKNSALSPETQIVTSVFLLLYGCSLVMFVVIRKNTRHEQIQQPVGIDVLSEKCNALASTHQFSARQTEVVNLLVHGYDIPSIAKKLFISENTVRTHTKKIYSALEVHSKQEIVNLVNTPTAQYPDEL